MLLETLRRRAVPVIGAVALLAAIPIAVADATPRHQADSRHDDGPRTVLRSSVFGNQVTDPTVFGVRPGTNPWVIKRGTTRLRADGQFTLRVRGLVIPTAPANGTNPVPTLSASVYCSGVIVATTPTVPFSPRGDAQIETDVGDLPSPCVAPTVFVHPNAVTSVYIAFNGSR